MNKLKDLYAFENENKYYLRIQNNNDWSREIVIEKGEDMCDVHNKLENFVRLILWDIKDGR